MGSGAKEREREKERENQSTNIHLKRNHCLCTSLVKEICVYLYFIELMQMSFWRCCCCCFSFFVFYFHFRSLMIVGSLSCAVCIHVYMYIGFRIKWNRFDVHLLRFSFVSLYLHNSNVVNIIHVRTTSMLFKHSHTHDKITLSQMWYTRLCDDDETLTKSTTQITLIDGFVQREFLRSSPQYTIHSNTHKHTYSHRLRHTHTHSLSLPHQSIYLVWHFLSFSPYVCIFFSRVLTRSHRFLVYPMMFIYIRFHSLYYAMSNNRMWSINENCKLHVVFSSVFIVVFLYALVALHFRWCCMRFF